jgi:glycosyltransferase involved in cell wall biosynthesis
MTVAGGVSEQALVDLYGGAWAVVFPPFDEDCGYVTLEAFLARKPVITTADAGGPLAFVENAVTGFVTEPTPEAIGAAMTRLVADGGARASAGRRRRRSRPHDDVGRRRRPPARGKLMPRC